MTEPQPNIVARNLSKRFGGTKAITDLSFEIRKGQIVGFLGPNGAGKSTTLRIMTGILQASSGHLSICGVPVSMHPAEVCRHIGYMPENNPLPEDMRVIEYLRFRARIKGIPLRRRRSRIEHALEVCELHRKERRKIIGTLSKGFRQRVGIADAILAAPEITILDEPTIGLDPHQVIAIRRLLDNLRGQTTVIFSSHILSEVEISCDRVLILNQGRLVAQGTAAELREEFLPGSRYQMEVAGEAGTIRKAMDKLGKDWEAQYESKEGDPVTSIILRSPQNGHSGDHILDQLVRTGGISIRSFHPLEPSLEEIFLTATRRSWAERAERYTPLPVERGTAS